MPTYTIETTDAQTKAIEAHIEDVQAWLQHAVSNKARKCENRIIEAISKYDPNKLTAEERADILDKVTVEPYSEERQKKDIGERLTV